MQRIYLENNFLKFYCPATGNKILSEEDFNSSPAMLFCYSDGYFMHINDSVAPLLEQFEIDLKEPYMEHDDFDKLLGQKDHSDVLHSDVLLFEITYSGIACGPSSSTMYIAIDMDYLSSEDIEEMEKDPHIEAIRENHTLESFKALLNENEGKVSIKIKDENGIFKEIHLDEVSEDLAMLCFYEDLDLNNLEEVMLRPNWSEKTNLFFSYWGDSQWDNEFAYKEFFDFLNELYVKSEIVGYEIKE